MFTEFSEIQTGDGQIIPKKKSTTLLTQVIPFTRIKRRFHQNTRKAVSLRVTFRIIFILLSVHFLINTLSNERPPFRYFYLKKSPYFHQNDTSTLNLRNEGMVHTLCFSLRSISILWKIITGDFQCFSFDVLFEELKLKLKSLKLMWLENRFSLQSWNWLWKSFSFTISFFWNATFYIITYS